MSATARDILMRHLSRYQASVDGLAACLADPAFQGELAQHGHTVEPILDDPPGLMGTRIRVNGDVVDIVGRNGEPIAWSQPEAP